MTDAIRKAVLHIDPLKSTVKTELLHQDGTRTVKHIPSDALVSSLQENSHIAPQATGLLPPGCISLTLRKDGWDVTLQSTMERDTVFYHKTGYADFPLPHFLLRCQLQNDMLRNFRMAVVEPVELKPNSKLYRFPFPNVNGFSLCVGTNRFSGYDTLWKLRGVMHRVLSIPFGDDYYRPEHTKLGLSARELFEHLRDKEPAYYYSDVLIPNGKTLADFIGG